MSGRRSRSLSPHRLSKYRVNIDHIADEDNENEKEAQDHGLSETAIPLDKKSLDKLKHRIKKLNKQSQMNDIPLLEIQEEENDPMEGGPLLPVFSQTSAGPSPEHQRSRASFRDRSQERENIIANEIEGDFDEEFNARPGLVIPKLESKEHIITDNNKNDDANNNSINTTNSVQYYEDSSADESTDEDGSMLDNDNASRFYHPSAYNGPSDPEGDDEDNERHIISDTVDKIKRKFSVSFSHSNQDAKSLNSDSSAAKSIIATDSLFKKVLHLGQTSSALPGSERVRPRDEEEMIGDSLENIPLYDLKHFKKEAKDIVSKHAILADIPSSDSTLNLHNLPTFDNGQEYLVDSTNLPDYDEVLGETDLPKKVKPGVTSGLLALYNNGRYEDSSIIGSEFDDIPLTRRNSPSTSTLDNNSSSILTNPFSSRLDKQTEMDSSKSSLEQVDSRVNHHKRTFSSQSIRNLISGSKERTTLSPTGTGRGRDEKPTIRNLISGSRERNSSRQRGRSKERSLYALPDFSKKSTDFEIDDDDDNGKSAKAKQKKKKKKSVLPKVLKKKAKKHETTARITVHIADVLQRQRFILTLCKAFMTYGAPNHRLEECLSMTARVLEIDSTFVYFPGIMIISFTDAVTRTSEVKLVRCSQGLDLGKLDSTHEIYKSVVHDRMDVEEASRKIENILETPPYFNKLYTIFFYGMSSCSVISWAFGGSWLDIPISFIFGCILAYTMFILAPKSSIYSSVFEVSSSIWLSFLGRAIGSIGGGKYFCFGAITNGGICMILPGYIILSGALEIQSKSLVAGTVRMFYAIIYSLFLGFGLTLGSALYGWIDKDATTKGSCTSNISPYFNLLMVPLFTVVQSLACQATFSQLPIQVFIGCGGYVVTYFAGKHFSVTEFNSALGSFTIGLLSNLYSRIGKNYTRFKCSMAFTAMLPGIFDQVPGGVASRSFLASSITNATSTSTSSSSLAFGVTMIEIAIGITVGLFVSTMVVYPFGKSKTGLFTL